MINNKDIRNIRTVFVCANVIKDQLIIDTLLAENEENAINSFYEKYKLKPLQVLGPFVKRKVTKKQIDYDIGKIQFLNQTKKAIYEDWLVTAFLLKEPEDHALLIFIKPIDQSRKSKPNKKIVSIKELRFINE